MSLNNHLILIGFMGVGKTSVSKILADRLAQPLLDTDALIVSQYGSISDLILSKGEPFFRDVEYQVFSTILQGALAIIATGGGIVTHQPSQQLLTNFPHVIWLKASFAVLESRIKSDPNNDRPLADDGIKERFYARQKLYHECATFTVDVDALSVEEVAEKIINRYG